MRNQIGFKAQQLKTIFPELVHFLSGFNLFTVNYDMMVPVVVEAIKEQQQTIVAQEQTIEQLNQRLAELEQVVKELIEKK